MSGRGAKAFAAGLASVLTLAVATGASRVYLARASRSAPTPALGTLPQCASYDGLPHGWGQDQHAGMVRIKAGDFQLGSDRGYAEERPLLDQAIDTFWIDRTEVTNAQFASFVAATGYVTEVEHHPGVALFRIPANSELLAPGSWWHLQEGADWRHPEGPESGIVGRAHEPVVDVTYADALAYAHWLGHELPSEAQWEFAAKAGRGNVESDHSLRDAHGHPLANFWQGMFPLRDTAEDGFAGRAPVGCFAASPNGLFDMVGNVWEWTTDFYHDGHAVADGNTSLEERIAAIPLSTGAPRRVIKGGSYLCSADYCVRARASSRQGQESDLPAVHVGFRTIARDRG